MKVAFVNCSKRFLTGRGSVQALQNLTLQVADGELLVLLGPSGCGKSTLLDLAAGLEPPSSGEIWFDERLVAAPQQRLFVPPRGRNVAMVLQSYALYPHLSVYDNIAFPLRISREPKASIPPRVQQMGEMLGLTELLGRKPGELSGGQRQRVAMARALVRRPEVFLLDEPLSNLDAQLRTNTRVELKRLQQELGITTVHVTHDQTEAMTLGDRIALLREGQLVQLGTPLELYEQPATPFAATFVGSPPMNLLPATWEEQAGQSLVTYDQTSFAVPAALAVRLQTFRSRNLLLGIRPEHLHLTDAPTAPALVGTVHAVESLGRETLVHVQVGTLAVLVLHDTRHRTVGEVVRLLPEVERFHVFPPEP